MRSNNPRVISFSGIDGAGKSTQIEALQSHLRELGFRSTLYTFWDNVVVFPGLREHMSFKAFKGDKGVGSRAKPINRQDKNVTSWYVTAFRLLLYLLDAYSLRLAVSGSSEAGADFIIFDRVDADPESAHARKPEYPLEFVRKNRDAYITLSRLVRGVTVLAPLSVEETTAKIKESISRKCLQADIGPVDLPWQYPASPSEAKTPQA
jgi:hypothetical protein